MKKIAVILSGSGHKDGSEITEAVSTLITLVQCGAQYEIFAPDIEVPTVDHITAKPQPPRNVRSEAARIGRGKVSDIKTLKADNFDGLVLPGGYGAAKVLCKFAEQGAKCEVNADVERVLNEFYQQEKPIGAICIAPALVARVLGPKGITVTIGNDSETASEIQKTGAQHENCAVEDFITDREHRIVTTPAYMYDDATPAQVFKGIQGCVKELVEMA